MHLYQAISYQHDETLKCDQNNVWMDEMQGQSTERRKIEIVVYMRNKVIFLITRVKYNSKARVKKELQE